MSDPQHKLSVDEVMAAGLSDWRQVMGTIRARFRTGDFATGLALVDRIGAAAEEAGHHPDLRLSYPEVIVDLSSHDVGGITSRDIDLARTISGYAAEVGAAAETGGLTQLDIGLDTTDPERLGPFYAALLGSDLQGGEPVDASGQVPTVWFQTAPETEEDAGPALPDPAVPQRWHLDVWVPADEAEARVRSAVEAGGTLISDAAAPSYWVLEDADGNRSCVCAVSGR